MSENVTFSTFVDEELEGLDEVEAYTEDNAPYIIMHYFELCYTTLLVVIGVPCNILALLVLIRRRLWQQYEAYVYLAAILIINTVKLVLLISNQWLYLIDQRLVRLSTAADILCKFWIWLLYVISYINWLHVLMLLNVYLRQQLITSGDVRGCFINLAAKYCTLFGTKVVITSFFIICTLANFFSFALSNLESIEDNWHCPISVLHWRQFELLFKTSWWLGINMSVIAATPLLLLVVLKIKRSSGFKFGHMNGGSQDNGDVEVMVRIVLLCASVSIVIYAPLVIVHVMYTFDSVGLKNIHIAFGAVRLIGFSSTLSTPIVCFAVKSRIRDDLKAIVQRCCYRCCPGSIFHGTLSPEPDSNDTVVLGMVPFEEDSPNM